MKKILIILTFVLMISGCNDSNKETKQVTNKNNNSVEKKEWLYENNDYYNSYFSTKDGLTYFLYAGRLFQTDFSTTTELFNLYKETGYLNYLSYCKYHNGYIYAVALNCNKVESDNIFLQDLVRFKIDGTDFTVLDNITDKVEYSTSVQNMNIINDKLYISMNYLGDYSEKKITRVYTINNDQILRQTNKDGDYLFDNRYNYFENKYPWLKELGEDLRAKNEINNKLSDYKIEYYNDEILCFSFNNQIVEINTSNQNYNIINLGDIIENSIYNSIEIINDNIIITSEKGVYLLDMEYNILKQIIDGNQYEKFKFTYSPFKSTYTFE